MARIRSIKPEFFTSPDMARLSVLARLTFIGLWTHVDDEGRCLYEPRLIHAALFALDDEVSIKRLHAALIELENGGQVTSYEHQGRRYLQIVAWHHQQISHKSQSKLPPPPTESAGQDTPDSGEAPEKGGNPPETLRPDQGSGIRDQGTSPLRVDPHRSGASVSLNGHSPPSASEIDREFQRWWACYPRKVGKKDALKAYRRARREVDAAKLDAGIQGLCAQVRSGTELRFIPHPSTWLNAGRWDDEPLPPNNDGGSTLNGVYIDKFTAARQ